jgi:hypothetical protein
MDIENNLNRENYDENVNLIEDGITKSINIQHVAGVIE